MKQKVYDGYVDGLFFIFLCVSLKFLETQETEGRITSDGAPRRIDS